MNFETKLIIALLILMVGLHINTERRITRIETKVELLLSVFGETVKKIFKGD